MKILLFGKNGQLGWELQRQRDLARLGDIIALDVDSTDHCGDFTKPDGIRQTLKDIAPDIIINAAAYTAVDKAESEPALAHTINAEAPALLAHYAKEHNIWLVHYSTDYVFDGSGKERRNESAEPNPINVYGKTKLAGDQAIIESGCKHLIFRTSWVYGAHGDNFFNTMLKLARERDEIKVVDDQIGAPTWTKLLADATAICIRHVQEHPEAGGLYHFAPGSEISWFGYACYLIEAARKLGMPTRIRPDGIKAVPSSAYPTQARRPANSLLDCRKFEKAFRQPLPNWQNGVWETLEKMAKEQSWTPLKP